MTKQSSERSICFCNSNRVWGGGEKWHLEAALAMAERGCKVWIMAGPDTALYERAGQYQQLGRFAQRFSNLDFLNPLALSRTASFFRKNRIQRIMCGLTADVKGAGLAAKLAGVPGIFYQRGLAVPVRNSALNRFLYGRVLDGLILNSRETGRQVLANNPNLMDKSRIHLNYNGLDSAAFDAALAAAGPDLRQSETLMIGNAGRLTAQKGQHYLLHMSRSLLDRGLRHQLLIVGDGELASELKELAVKLDLGEHTRFAGFMDKMAPFWRSIDILVLSSLWEGFGYVLAEAMLAEKPCIAFDGNSMPELVQDGDTGLLTPMPQPGESDAEVGRRLADQVLRLTENPEFAARLAARGREFCLQNFEQKDRMDQLYNLLWPEDGEY